VDLAMLMWGKILIFFDLGLHVDAAAVFVEQHLAIYQGKQCPVASGANILAGDELRAALPNQNTARRDSLTAKFFYAKPFADAVASITNAALSFFMCHNSELLML